MAAAGAAKRAARPPAPIELLYGKDAALDVLVRAVPEGDRYALALSAPALWRAVRDASEPREGGKRTLTRPEDVFATPARMQWVLGWKERGPTEVFPEHCPVYLRRRGERIGLVGQFGALATLEWAHASGWAPEDTTSSSMDNAVRGGKLANVQWMRGAGCGWGTSTCALAASVGDLQTLRWLREKECPWNKHTCWSAARGGHLETLEWAIEEGCTWDDFRCSEAAARGGHLATLQWLQGEEIDEMCMDTGTCEAACDGGHLETLQWARARGCPWETDACAAAASGGHLETLKWARGQGCDWERCTCAAAARFGHLETLKWAHANGCPWGESTCSEAAFGGHLETLQWARAQGCPWGQGTCADAASGGHLEILKWVRAEGCPWNRLRTYICGENSGSLEVLQWLRTNGCPWVGTWPKYSHTEGGRVLLRVISSE